MNAIFMYFVFYMLVLGASYGIVKTAQAVTNRYGDVAGVLVTLEGILLSGLGVFAMIALFIGAI